MHGVTPIIDCSFVAQRISVAVEHDDELVLCTDSNRQQRAILAGELQTIQVFGRAAVFSLSNR